MLHLRRTLNCFRIASSAAGWQPPFSLEKISGECKTQALKVCAFIATFSASWTKFGRLLQNASRWGMTIFRRNDRPHIWRY
jgi:hypothetical protein